MTSNIKEEIISIKERFSDMLDSFSRSYNIELDYQEHEPQGSNFYGITTFKGTINGIPYKVKELKYMPYKETAESYINSVKAYLFEVLDAVAAL